jgi:hypothetical protein
LILTHWIVHLDYYVALASAGLCRVQRYRQLLQRALVMAPEA